MKTKSKTFQEGDEITPALMFASDHIWNYVVGDGNHGDETYYLDKKIKVTVTIYEDNSDRL